MKKLLNRYSWLFEWFGAAVIIGFSIVVLAEDQILYYIVGITFVIFGLFRVVPLVKTTDDKLMKWLWIVEMVIDVVAGGVLIYFATLEDRESVGNIFGYIIGGVLYLRGFLHFLATSLRHEPSTFIPFLLNIAFVTLGTVVFAVGSFDESKLSWIIFVLALLSSGIIIFRGYGSFKKYRYDLAINEKTKEVKKEVPLEAPTSDEIIVNIDDTIIKKEEERDEIHA